MLQIPIFVSVVGVLDKVSRGLPMHKCLKSVHTPKTEYVCGLVCRDNSISTILFITVKHGRIIKKVVNSMKICDLQYNNISINSYVNVFGVVLTLLFSSIKLTIDLLV